VSVRLGLDQIRSAPKVLLHDHLDGGLRPARWVELAAEQGYRELPTTDPQELAAWFVSAAPRHDLVPLPAGFAHTVGVMQTCEALERVATECVEDLIEDGVVYAEVRLPRASYRARPDDRASGRVGARGLRRRDGACRRGRAADHRPHSAHGHAHRSPFTRDRRARSEVPGRRVVGFDVAAPRPAIRRQLTSMPSTSCSARTSMHRACWRGVRPPLYLAGDPVVQRRTARPRGSHRRRHRRRPDGGASLGRLASYVRDRRIPLEMCPTSNVHHRGGAFASPIIRSGYCAASGSGSR